MPMQLVTCAELDRGDLVKFPTMLILLEPERAGVWLIKRVWNDGATDRQLRMVRVGDKTVRWECLRVTVEFERLSPEEELEAQAP